MSLGPSGWGHREANPVHQEQCRLVVDLAVTFNFQRRNTFFRCTGTPERIAPVAKLNARFLINRADANGELFLAIVATPQVPAITFASLCIPHLVDCDTATLEARGRVSPALLFEELHSGSFIRAREWNFFDNFRFREVMLFFHKLILHITQCLRQVNNEVDEKNTCSSGLEKEVARHPDRRSHISTVQSFNSTALPPSLRAPWL